MSTKTKFLLGAGVCLLALALTEQLTQGHFYFSYLTSTTHTEQKRPLRPVQTSFALGIERPIARWLPFVKYGETIYLHTYQSSDPAKADCQLIATTRTKLLVVGLCSTANYERLANEPYKDVHEEYLRKYGMSDLRPGPNPVLRTVAAYR